MATLSAQLVDLIRSRPISAEDRKLAALFVLDAVASSIAGRNSDQGRILLRWAERQRHGNSLRLSAGDEAFLMGALTHILEVDDVHRASISHPGCVVVPAAWAIARREETGADGFLAAVLRGFEAMCRIGMAVGREHYTIWHNTATCGPFGSAMAVGDLLGLSDSGMIDALGNAGTQSAGLWEFNETGAMSKHLHAGNAARAGVLAADLAGDGFTGPPAILEGERGFFQAMCPDARPDLVLADENAPWQLGLTSIKPWPSCRHTHPAIDAASEIHSKINGLDIEAVKVETYQAALDLCDRAAPETEYQAKFSLQHCVAAALTRDEVGFSAFDSEARNELAPLSARVQVTRKDAYEAGYPNALGSAVEVTFTDGSSVSAVRMTAKGDPEAPLSEEELRAKAATLISYAGIAPQTVLDRMPGPDGDESLPDLTELLTRT